jgi:hypothetical protein
MAEAAKPRAEPGGQRWQRPLILLLYFSLAAISSYFNDFEAWDVGAVRQALANRDEAGELAGLRQAQPARPLRGHPGSKGGAPSPAEVLTSAPTLRELEHMEAIQGVVRAPVRYRPLSFWMTELLRRATGLPYLITDFYMRMLFLFFCGLAFHSYLRRWLDVPTTVLGVVLLFALMPAVYWRGYHKLYDFVNLLIFILGYTIIRAKRDWWLVPLLAVGMFNRETTVMLVVVYFCVRWGELPVRTLLLRSGLLGLMCMAIYVGLRLVYSYASWFHWYELRENPLDPQTYVHLLLFFNAFWVLAFLDWRSKPRFLRRAMLMAPLFFGIHFVVGYVREVRLFLPLVPLFIPLGLLTLRGWGEGQRGGLVARVKRRTAN